MLTLKLNQGFNYIILIDHCPEVPKIYILKFDEIRHRGAVAVFLLILANVTISGKNIVKTETILMVSD